MYMTIEGAGLPNAQPEALFKTTLPNTGGYRRIEASLDRSPRLQWLRITVECYEAYNETPVRIEVCPLRKFGHILRDRYGVRAVDFSRAASDAGLAAALRVEILNDLSADNERKAREESEPAHLPLELMEVGH